MIEWKKTLFITSANWLKLRQQQQQLKEHTLTVLTTARHLMKEANYAYVLLAFIAMAGLAYINFLPALVTALITGAGLSNAEAGQVVSSNSYGAILGNFIALFLSKRVKWRTNTFSSLLVLTIMELYFAQRGYNTSNNVVHTSNFIHEYYFYIGYRFITGVLGGIAMGCGFKALAHLPNSNKAFGTLLLFQFCIGSLVIFYLPNLEISAGSFAVFYIMAAITFIGVVFTLIIPIPKYNTDALSARSIRPRLLNKTTITIISILFLAVFLYQTAASTIWAYSLSMGLHFNLAEQDINFYIALTGSLGFFGAIVPIAVHKKLNYRLFVIGVISSITSTLLLTLINQINLLPLITYAASMALLFFSWPMVVSLLLANIANHDNTGRSSSAAALFSSLGIATGPLLGSVLLTQEGFLIMLLFCAALFLACLAPALLTKNTLKHTPGGILGYTHD